MDLVRFPGLNIELNISKIAFELFGIEIYFYAICIVLGISIALILARLSKEKFGIKYEKIIETMIGAIAWGYIGARLYYVIFNLNDYIQNPLKILNIRDGGLAIYGGIIFAGLFIFIKCKKDKINFLDFCDYIIPFVSIAQCIGRWGNFFNKEAYGYETMSGLRMGIYDYSGKYLEVHPTFLYESICNFIIFIILSLISNKRKFKGQIIYTYFVLYGLVRFFIEELRLDSLMIGDYKISQILSIILVIVFGIVLIYKRIKNKR